MTAVRTLRSASSEHLDRPLARRLIGVGIHDVLQDRATIEWAVREAAPGRDSVHLVHAYVPLRLDGCAWGPVSADRDRRHTAASRVVAQAVQRASEEHHDLEVGGSAIGGLPEDVLIELGSVVGLLVIGDDSHDPMVARKISTRVQDRARCPVVCVPRDYLPSTDDRPVTVVADDQGVADPVLTFAAEFARPHHRTVQVGRVRSAAHEPNPAGPEMGYSELDRLRAGSSLLVAAVRSVDLLRSPSDPIDSCPIAVVPE